MKKDTEKYSDEFAHIVSDMKGIIKDVREELAEGYDIENRNSDHYRYLGLCDTAAIMVLNKIYTLIPSIHDTVECVTTIHGELAHIPGIHSSLWFYQHTWVRAKVVLGDEKHTIYIDPTASQFSLCDVSFHFDIPDWTISVDEKPFYLLADMDNLRWGKRKPKIITIMKTRFKWFDEFWDRFIVFWMYIVYGKIVDIITKLKYRK